VSTADAGLRWRTGWLAPEQVHLLTAVSGVKVLPGVSPLLFDPSHASLQRLQMDSAARVLGARRLLVLDERGAVAAHPRVAALFEALATPQRHLRLVETSSTASRTCRVSARGDIVAVMQSHEGLGLFDIADASDEGCLQAMVVAIAGSAPGEREPSSTLSGDPIRIPVEEWRAFREGRAPREGSTPAGAALTRMRRGSDSGTIIDVVVTSLSGTVLRGSEHVGFFEPDGLGWDLEVEFDDAGTARSVVATPSTHAKWAAAVSSKARELQAP